MHSSQQEILANILILSSWEYETVFNEPVGRYLVPCLSVWERQEVIHTIVLEASMKIASSRPLQFKQLK